MPAPHVVSDRRGAGLPPAAARNAARCAGLRWVSANEPGLRRVARAGGKGFGYRLPDGRWLRDADELARVRKLAVPPAWTDVWICRHANGHLQATGFDARGRKQYRYHAAWQAQRGQTKFDDLVRVGQALPRIRAHVQRELDRQPVAGAAALPSRERVLATLVRLLDTTCVRIGNASYRRLNGSFGLSTLHNRHAGLSGDEIRLTFVGKGGVRHQVRLTDRRVARVLRRCRDLPGRELFQYVDPDGSVHRVDSADVNAWLSAAAGWHVTAKDFRTWHGSVLALQLTLDACAEDAQPFRPQDVLAGVAQRLGNTPAVCRKAYVHPRVLALGAALGDAHARQRLRSQAWVLRAPPTRGLNSGERRLLALLKGRAGVPAAT